MYKVYQENYFEKTGALRPEATKLFKEKHPFFNFSRQRLETGILKLIRKTLGRGYSFKLVPRGRWTGDSDGAQVYVISREDERYYLKLSTSIHDVLGMIIGSSLSKEKPISGLEFVDLLHYGSIQTKEEPLLFFSISREAPGTDLIQYLIEEKRELIFQYSSQAGKILAALQNKQVIIGSDKDKILAFGRFTKKFYDVFYSSSAKLEEPIAKLFEEFHAKVVKKYYQLNEQFMSEKQILIPFYGKFSFSNSRMDPENHSIILFDTTTLSKFNTGTPPLIFANYLVAEYLIHLYDISWNYKLDKGVLITSLESFWRSYQENIDKNILTKAGIQMFILSRLASTTRKMITHILEKRNEYTPEEVIFHFEPLLDDDHMLYTPLDDL